MASWAYFDASCLVKLLVAEPESEACRRGYMKAERVTTSILAWVEIPQAIARKQAEGGLDDGQVRSLLELVDSTLKADVATVAIPDATARALQEIPRLVQRHPRLRALDTLHLASAITVRERATPENVEFYCTDKRLAEAARREGFVVLP